MYWNSVIHVMYTVGRQIFLKYYSLLCTVFVLTQQVTREISITYHVNGATDNLHQNKKQKQKTNKHRTKTVTKTNALVHAHDCQPTKLISSQH